MELIKTNDKSLIENDCLLQENKKLTDKIIFLEKEKLFATTKNFAKQNKELLQENKKYNDELEKLKPFVEKFTYSSEKLNMLLNNQRAIFNKAGLGFKSQK